jgi:hypothetical protein
MTIVKTILIGFEFGSFMQLRSIRHDTRCQTPFGNAFRETPFRKRSNWDKLNPAQCPRETEIRKHAFLIGV